jgi:hypothetical protein
MQGRQLDNVGIYWYTVLGLVNTIIRLAALLAVVLIALVSLAAVDPIPDHPGFIKEQQNFHPSHLPDGHGFSDSREVSESLLLTTEDRSLAGAWFSSGIGIESFHPSNEISTLRVASDPSPPIARSSQFPGFTSSPNSVSRSRS